MSSIMDALSGLQEESGPASAPAAAEAIAAVHVVDVPEKSCVVFCGSTDWVAAAKGAAGKQKQKADGAMGEEFNSPVVVGGALCGVRVASLSVGPCAGHVLALTSGGHVFAWGQNGQGQLGLGKEGPWCVPGPARAKLWEALGTPTAAATGKNHTLVCYADGTLAACGAGDRGALGLGERKADMPEALAAPKAVPGPAGRGVVAVAAGCDFSLAALGDGSLYSWGWTEFGKLGLGDDGCYNTKDSSIKLTYTASGSPAKVALGADAAAKVVQVSAGKNQGRKRVIQRRLKVGVLEAMFKRKASTLGVRPER